MMSLYGATVFDVYRNMKGTRNELATLRRLISCFEAGGSLKINLEGYGIRWTTGRPNTEVLSMEDVSYLRGLIKATSSNVSLSCDSESNFISYTFKDMADFLGNELQKKEAALNQESTCVTHSSI